MVFGIAKSVLQAWRRRYHSTIISRLASAPQFTVVIDLFDGLSQLFELKPFYLFFPLDQPSTSLFVAGN